MCRQVRSDGLKRCFFGDCPPHPLSKGLDDQSPPYLKVWIRHSRPPLKSSHECHRKRSLSNSFIIILCVVLLIAAKVFFFLFWTTACMCKGITEVRVWISGKPELFQVSFLNCISCIFHWDVLLCICFSISQFQFTKYEIRIHHFISCLESGIESHKLQMTYFFLKSCAFLSW